MPWMYTVVAIIAAAAAAYGTYEEGKARSKSYEYQAALARQNAALLRRRALAQQLAISQVADSNVSAVQGAAAEKAKELAASSTLLAGAQRATLGALGVSGVTAADIVGGSFDKSIMDQMAIRYSADVKRFQIREQSKQDIFSLQESTKSQSYALESNALQFEYAAKTVKRSSRIATVATLFGGTATAFNSGGSTGSTIQTKQNTTSAPTNTTRTNVVTV